MYPHTLLCSEVGNSTKETFSDMKSNSQRNRAELNEERDSEDEWKDRSNI